MNPIDSILDNDKLLFEYEIPGLEYKKAMLSPFGDDSRPSFIVYDNSPGKSIYVDFRYGSGDIIDFTERKHNMNKNEAMFYLLTRLENLNLHQKNERVAEERITEYRLPLPFRGELRARRDYGFKEAYFWNSLGISIDLLKSERVYPLDYFAIKTYRTISTHDRFMFIYDYSHIEPYAFKVYFINPKWFFMHTSRKEYLIDGLDALNNTSTGGELLLIDHSKKNYLYLKTLGFDVIARQDEHTPIPDNIILEAQSKYRKVINISDNDILKEENYGLLAGDKFEKNTGVPHIYPPDEFALKGQSDFPDMHYLLGADNVKDIIWDLVNSS